eukprot:3949000-Karenia_brevis.AAC.1
MAPGKALFTDPNRVKAEIRSSVEKFEQIVIEIEKEYNATVSQDLVVKVNQIDVPFRMLLSVPQCFKVFLAVYSLMDFKGKTTLECESLVETLLPELRSAEAELEKWATNEMPELALMVLEAAKKTHEEKQTWLAEL